MPRIPFPFQSLVSPLPLQVRKAEKFGTKIVSLDFMEKSVERGSLVDHAPFLLVPPPAGAAERDDGEDEE
jgi:hypothetical protein